MSSATINSPLHRDSLPDVLERILDKGVVVAGDVSISLVGIELLTIKLRLLICTIDKAKEIGINWWEADPALTGETQRLEGETQRLEDENAALRGRLAILEKRVASIGA